MKIIVTGGGGFIGGHTILELQKQEYEVLPLDVRDSVLFPQIKITKCDINSPELAQYIDEGDKILHLCAVPTVKDTNPLTVCRVNIEGTVNLVKIALEKKAERIVMASSGAVYFGEADIHPPLDEETPTQPNTFYGFSKVVGEQILHMHRNQLPYVVLRYGYIYGYGDRGAITVFLKLLSQDKRPVIFWGKQLVEMVYVKDVVQANIKALETIHTNEIYNIGSGVVLQMRDIYNICASLLDKTHIEPIIKPLRAWDQPNFWFDIRKAMKYLGYSPKWTLTEGIKDEMKVLGLSK